MPDLTVRPLTADRWADLEALFAACGCGGAIAYAHKRGARMLEAYPVDRAERSSDEAMWFCARSMYDDAGFREVARRRPHRPVVRRSIAPARRSASRRAAPRRPGTQR